MNEEQRKPNVVELAARGMADRRSGDLIEAVDAIATRHARQLVGRLFENVDDALFDLAEKAESNVVQTRYFDGMREVRRKRQLIERLFVDHVHRRFKDFASGKLNAPAPVGTGESPGSADELRLVEDADLEESLAITSMSGKAEGHFARVLYAVNQRLAVISGGSKVTDGNNPVGPACLCDCFRQAMRELEADINVKLIIYKLFERYVLADLEVVYDEINDALVNAGVLPQLQRRVSGRRRTDRGTTGAAPAGGEGPMADELSAGTEEALRQQLYATVNDLLSQRRELRQPAGSAYAGGGPTLTVRELLSAIALLQQETPPIISELAAADVQRSDSLSLEELKAALLQQINKIREDSRARVAGADEDTIDLVGMIFEFVLEDPNLPAQMQAILGRLQIPYLKVALLDKQMFAHQSHPARRLLDQLADAAKGWSKDSDEDLRLFNEIKAIVETLLHEFNDDLQIFERLLHRLHAFQESNSVRAERVEKRTTETIRGKEKLDAARLAAAHEVLSRTRDAQLPTLVRSILTRPWANYLVLTLLRQGEDSNEWRSGVRFMDDLIASSRPPRNDQERLAIRGMLPQIEKTLRHGLATVAFSEDDVRRLMRALGQFYLALLGDEDTREQLRAGAPEGAVSEHVIPESVPEIIAPEPPGTPAAPAEEDSPLLQRARALKLGNWVEFVRADGHRDRAKLSWISPISGKYLFVNRRGLKVCDMTVHALAASIEDGSTLVLEEVPLFDRALDAIVERLRKDRTSTGDGSTGSDPAAPSPEAG